MQNLFSNFQIPVLTYHHVSDDIDYYTSVNHKTFINQMEEILKRFECINLETALDMYANNQKPTNQFVITFDDGYKDNIFALDYLSDKSIKSLVFLPTATLGQDNKWNHKATYIAPNLNEEEIRQLYQKGHQFGSHGRIHQCLTKLNDKDLIEEVKGSKEKLMQLVPNQKYYFFAYPFGFYDERVKQVVKENFHAAFATNKTAPTTIWTDLFQIYRLSVNKDTPTESIVDYLYGKNRT